MKTTLIIVALWALVFIEIASAQTSMLDPSFGSAGTSRDSMIGGGGWDDRVSAIAIQPNGKIVVAGRSGGPASLQWSMALARYDTDGTLDQTFGTNGTVRTFITGGGNRDDEATSVLIQPDGRIVVGGFTYISGSVGVQFAAARYDSNGALDNGFGISGGTVRTTVGGVGGLAQSTSAALQPDGKIVLAGFSDAPPGNGTFALARFNATGFLDPTFGSGGTFRGTFDTTSGASASARAVCVQSDGKILIMGSAVGRIAVERFDSTGTPDNTFGVDGVATGSISGGNGQFIVPYAMTLQSDGKILLAGEAQDSLSELAFAIARLNADGTPDSAFGVNGLMRNPIAGSNLANSLAYSVALGPDGTIAMAGTSFDSSGNAEFGVMRFDSTGKPDNTFGFNGTTRSAISGGGGTSDEAFSVAVSADGRIVAAGLSSGPPTHPGSVFAVARYLNQNPTLGIGASAHALPSRISLLQNYPNPFNPSTSLGYEVSREEFVTLKVYDILGREVSTLVSETKQPGKYAVVWNASTFSSGTYFVRMTAAGFSQVRKLLLLK